MEWKQTRLKWSWSVRRVVVVFWAKKKTFLIDFRQCFSGFQPPNKQTQHFSHFSRVKIKWNFSAFTLISKTNIYRQRLNSLISVLFLSSLCFLVKHNKKINFQQKKRFKRLFNYEFNGFCEPLECFFKWYNDRHRGLAKKIYFKCGAPKKKWQWIIFELFAFAARFCGS